MSVFLRWGIFGILAVAALVYAYNASKSMADKRAAKSGVAVSTAAPTQSDDESDSDTGTEAAPEAAATPEPASPADCEAELVVAQLALEARRQAEPFDRLLRVQEIAWQEPAARRHRLANVARRWYDLEGEEPGADALRAAVISDCEKVSPAP